MPINLREQRRKYAGRPGRLIAALVAADDPTLNGRIVDIHDEEALRFLETATP